MDINIKTNKIPSLEKLFNNVDTAVSVISKKFAHLVRCRPGCTDCCYALFDISFIEALNLTLIIKDLKRSERRKLERNAKKFKEKFSKLVKAPNISTMSQYKIRCPLLTDNGLCYLYWARPVNCRIYGVPTTLDGKAHVCGLSGFIEGDSYPTIEISKIQRQLLDLSLTIAPNKLLAYKRFMISEIILSPQLLNF